MTRYIIVLSDSVRCETHFDLYYRLYRLRCSTRRLCASNTLIPLLLLYITRVVLLQGLGARRRWRSVHFESGRCAPRPSPTVVRLGHHRHEPQLFYYLQDFIANISSSHLQRHNHGLHVLYACAPRTARALAAQALGRTFPVHTPLAPPPNSHHGCNQLRERAVQAPEMSIAPGIVLIRPGGRERRPAAVGPRTVPPSAIFSRPGTNAPSRALRG